MQGTLTIRIYRPFLRGAEYLHQSATRCGNWFGGVDRPENLTEALQGWYTPDGPP